ncbi:hypothetical protein AVEN_8525-1 [Araneus ventricosus]|uniref:Uncharacterized protein n=1 Tax=Araneus ventricosus TaxID=182803 RepID=A0A4Y2FL27_ARAVE|nr:hypothetical protein AVEN_8525-1 [Araneus ventricosus]
MESDALFQKSSRKHETQIIRETALVQSSISRQKVTNNNKSSTNDSIQRLTADQFTQRAGSKEISIPGFSSSLTYGGTKTEHSNNHNIVTVDHVTGDKEIKRNKSSHISDRFAGTTLCNMVVGGVAT